MAHYDEALSTASTLVKGAIDSGKVETNFSLQLKLLNQSLTPGSKLQKLSVGLGDAVQKTAIARLSLADGLSDHFLKPTKELANDVTTKFTSKKIDDEIQKEIEYQNARRDEEYFVALKSFTKSYIDFFETCAKNFHNLDEQLKEWEKKTSKTNIQRVEMVGEPIFGVRLENLKRPIPSDIDKLIDYIEANYLDKEGIYRIPGGLEITKKLKSQMDTGVPFDEIVAPSMQEKPFVMCGLLKLWVRELPEPLLTLNNFDECLYIAKLEDSKRRTELLANILDFKLPPNYKKVLGRLMTHFAKVCEHGQNNKMNPSSISVVFGMNILKPRKEDPNFLALNAGYINKVTEILIQNVEYLFNSDEKERTQKFRGASFRLEMSLLEGKTKSGNFIPRVNDKDDELEKWVGENGETPEINVVSSPKFVKKSDSEVSLKVTNGSESDLKKMENGSESDLTRTSDTDLKKENSPPKDVTVHVAKPQKKGTLDMAIDDLEQWLME